ncbi:MAG: DUF3846 domain-containing protein [Erysipelotrichaceae bacterium]
MLFKNKYPTHQRAYFVGKNQKDGESVNGILESNVDVIEKSVTLMQGYSVFDATIEKIEPLTEYQLISPMKCTLFQKEGNGISETGVEAVDIDLTDVNEMLDDFIEEYGYGGLASSLNDKLNNDKIKTVYLNAQKFDDKLFCVTSYESVEPLNSKEIELIKSSVELNIKEVLQNMIEGKIVSGEEGEVFTTLYDRNDEWFIKTEEEFYSDYYMSKGEMKDPIKVVIIPPNKRPFVTTIDNQLEELQRVVGGYIELVALDDELDLFINEEGRLINLEPNRMVGNDVLVGIFLIASHDEDRTTSLSEEQIEKVLERFSEAESQEYLNEQMEEINSSLEQFIYDGYMK